MYKLILFANTTLKGQKEGLYDITYHFVFALQVLILFCCLAAGNDPYSQQLSDQEQLEFLARWKKEHGRE